MHNRKQAPLGWTTQDLPATGQPAPTTTTVGYLGQVIFDTDGNEWKCLNIPMNTWNQTANYIWALVDKDTFPSVNTEYVAYYDKSLSKLIYKYRHSGTMPANTAQTAIPINEAENSVCINITGYVEGSTILRIFLPAMTYNGTSRGTVHAETTSNLLKISINAANVAVQSKPFIANLFYYKV